MKILDRQISNYSQRLETEVGLHSEECLKVATLVAADVRFLPSDIKGEIKSASPVPIKARLDELIAFQAWMDLASSNRTNPSVTRAQVIVQNYICFIYLKDACFEVLANKSLKDSIANRCARFLTQGSIRRFRNAIAHANWCYTPDFSGLEYWVLKDSRKREKAMIHFQASQADLNFWQALSRCVAYATYTQLSG